MKRPGRTAKPVLIPAGASSPPEWAISTGDCHRRIFEPQRTRTCR